jgi:hypothetical protein
MLPNRRTAKATVRDTSLMMLNGRRNEQKERAQKGEILCWLAQAHFLDLFLHCGNDDFKRALPA